MISDPTTWPPDDRIRRAFAETARAYDDLARRNFTRIATELIDRVGVLRSHAVLDVAAGSGLVGSVMSDGGLGLPTAVDISSAMLRLAGGPRVVGDATKLPFRSESFDIAVCSLGLQMLENPDDGLKEMHRVLHSHGRIAVSLWGSERSDPQLDAAARSVLDSHLASQPNFDPTAFRIPQIVITDQADLAVALSECGFSGVDCWTRTKRTAFRGPKHYFDMLAVFPSTWIRLHRLGSQAADVRRSCVDAISKVVGGEVPFEITEQVLMGVAEKH